MSNANKDKGTRAETALVRYLIEKGWPHMERRALNGTGDRGDLAGIVGVVIQSKDVADPKFSKWFSQLLDQIKNASADTGILIHKRRYARGGPGKWDAYVQLGWLTQSDQFDPLDFVRMDLELVVRVLIMRGYQ